MPSPPDPNISDKDKAASDTETVEETCGEGTMHKKKSIQAKLVMHDHRRRFQEYVREKGREKMTLSYVYWAMFHRSGKGNVFELEEELFLGDLGISHPALFAARTALTKDGWLVNVPQFNQGKRGVTKWVVNTVATVNSVDTSTTVNSTTVISTSVKSVGVGSVYNTVVLHSLGALENQNPNASTSSVPQKQGSTSSAATDLPTNQLLVADAAGESKTLQTSSVKDHESATEDKTKANPTPDGYETSWGTWVSQEEVLGHMENCWSAYKTDQPTVAEFNLFVEIMRKCDQHSCSPEQAVDFAKTHMPTKLVGGLRSVKGLHNAVCGDNVSTTNGLIAQYADHYAAIADCWMCLKKVKDILCERCGKTSVFLLPDGSPSKYCKKCGKLGTVKSSAKGFTDEEVEYEMRHDGYGNPIAVGTGFDVEEA